MRLKVDHHSDVCGCTWCVRQRVWWQNAWCRFVSRQRDIQFAYLLQCGRPPRWFEYLRHLKVHFHRS